MIDRSKKTITELNEEFMVLADSISKGQDPYAIYLKCNSMRGIWEELRSRGEKPPWDIVRSNTINSILVPFKHPTGCLT